MSICTYINEDMQDELISTMTCGNILWRLVSKTHSTYWTKCFNRMMSWSPAAGKIDHFCTTEGLRSAWPSQVYTKQKSFVLLSERILQGSFAWPGPYEIIYIHFDSTVVWGAKSTFVLFWDTWLSRPFLICLITSTKHLFDIQSIAPLH